MEKNLEERTDKAFAKVRRGLERVANVVKDDNGKVSARKVAIAAGFILYGAASVAADVMYATTGEAARNAWPEYVTAAVDWGLVGSAALLATIIFAAYEGHKYKAAIE